MYVTLRFLANAEKKQQIILGITYFCCIWYKFIKHSAIMIFNVLRRDMLCGPQYQDGGCPTLGSINLSRSSVITHCSTSAIIDWSSVSFRKQLNSTMTFSRASSMPVTVASLACSDLFSCSSGENIATASFTPSIMTLYYSCQNFT